MSEKILILRLHTHTKKSKKKYVQFMYKRARIFFISHAAVRFLSKFFFCATKCAVLVCAEAVCAKPLGVHGANQVETVRKIG